MPPRWPRPGRPPTRIVIDDTQPLANLAGQVIRYPQILGHAFGELDPRDPLNALIQDIELGKDADGQVRDVASFVLTKPLDWPRPAR